MPTISGRYYSGFGYTGYKALVIHRARMAEANDRSANAVAMLTNTFSTASSNLAQGMAELATKAAIKRMSDEAAARAAAARSGLSLTA